MERKRITVATGEVLSYLESEGKGPTVVFIHGNMSGAVHWTETMENLCDAHSYAVDMRGFGESSYRNRAKSLTRYAEDVASFLQHLDLKEVHLVGWSAGGGVAMEVAAGPEGWRLSQLVLVGSVGIDGAPGIEHLGLNLEHNTSPSFFDPFGILGESVRRSRIDAIWRFFIYGANPPSPRIMERNIATSLSQRNDQDMVKALKDFSFRQQAPRLHLPITWIHGLEDPVVPYLEAVRGVRAFSHARLIPMHVGHSPMTDDLKGFCSVLHDVFQAVRR